MTDTAIARTARIMLRGMLARSPLWTEDELDRLFPLDTSSNGTEAKPPVRDQRKFKKLRIYLASSWKNEAYPNVLAALRDAGHEVYDFRAHGFHWETIDPDYRDWTHANYVAHVNSRAASDQFNADLTALTECDLLVLLLPCGRSAHLEAGYVAGRGKPVIVYLDEKFEPELMYRLGNGFVEDIPGLLLSLSLAAGAAATGKPDTDVTCIAGLPWWE